MTVADRDGAAPVAASAGTRSQGDGSDADQGPVTCVLVEDPGIGEHLSGDAFTAAARQSAARTLWLRDWPAGGIGGEAPPGSLGLLVLAGLLGRCVTVERRTWTELISVGDVIRPWRPERASVASTPMQIEWRVLSPARVALLDRAFVERMSAWPEVLVALVDRLFERTRTLGYALAVGGRVSVADRVELMLRDFADRWGRVTPDGIVVTLPGVTHELLATLVGAARPSVTSALTVLGARGTVQRLDGDSWLVSRRYGSTRPRRIA